MCDRKSLNSLGEMMFLAGVAIGGLVCGILSDKYGRKRTLMASVLIQSLLGEYPQVLQLSFEFGEVERIGRK